MQEDDFKSKKSDIGDTDKKKKYELRNRKNVEDMNDMSLTLTDAISILDKHETVKIVEENVTKNGNDEEEVKMTLIPEGGPDHQLQGRQSLKCLMKYLNHKNLTTEKNQERK